ncbi:MAG: hypothetical protein JMDDDDMK_01794 [Acidobacteria bacterium]|nr:hypothetical protein [Acidobacteriota bacterium]
MIFDDLNFLTLAIFAPILVLVGILGFIIPPDKSPTSGAAPYNIFHITFGVIGALIVLINHPSAIKAFNIGFGLIDLYQAIASHLGLFPKHIFKWTRVDDILHIVIGIALVVIGVFAD